MSYVSELSTKQFVGNVVIKFLDTYFSIRQPDSGLVIPKPFDRCISSLTLNPTQIDIRRISTTIASYSFKILDRDFRITNLVRGDAASLINQEVDIWIGRIGVSMPFSDYFKLPVTRIKKIDHSDNSYSFSTTEQTERIARPIYSAVSALAVDILPATTTITMRDSIESFPNSGHLKIEDEFMSYSGKNITTKQFTGVVRGEYGSTPAAHEMNTEATLAERVVDNPVNILLKILTSGSGSGAYDVLKDGLAISPSLIDLTTIEDLRDDFFHSVEYSLILNDIEDALKFIENEILLPNNLRFNYSTSSKLSLVMLNRSTFIEEDQEMDEDTISSYPKWSVDGNRVVNRIEVQWDYDETTNQFLRLSTSQDDDSINDYGESPVLKYSFKGIKEDLDGEELIDRFMVRLLARLAFPTPEISFKTQIDKSLFTIGDKARILSSQIPSPEGTLEFANELEIVSRAINFQTGDVQFKLAYTSFTNIRSCFIAPSDLIMSVISQNEVELAAGRGDQWGIGWKVRLWDDTNKIYTDDQVNTIESITDDTITFVDDWETDLGGAILEEGGGGLLTEAGETLGQEGPVFRLKFANYDEVIESQKRYCFISNMGNDFADGKPTYKITY